VRYFNGEVQIAVTDLSARGYGKRWQHRRTYSNRLTATADLGNGTNWLVETWPYLVDHPDGSVTVVRGTRGTLWFDLVDQTYVGRYGALSTLIHDPQNARFVLTLPGGQQYRFHDFDQLEFPQGGFASHLTRGGQLTAVTAYTDAERIEEIQRSTGDGPNAQTQSFRYSYSPAGRIESVTLRQRAGAENWTDLRRAAYDYYEADEPFGNEGDLKRAVTQLPDGTGWADTAVRYYRYYQPDDEHGFPHGLKYIVGPEPYARMLQDGLEPLEEPDAVLAQYADQYLEYDDQQRVTRELRDGGARNYTFEYTTSAHSDAYDHWKIKTVETRPDGSQHIVYTNYIGQILIKELRVGANRWIEYHKYDADGRRIEHARPSAVAGYDDAYADLNVTLNADTGLIHVTDYFAETVGVGARGRVQCRKIKHGSAGEPIKQAAFEYATHTAGGVTVHPVAKRTEFRHDDGAGAIDTTYDYAWHSGTVQTQQLTTTLPAVPTSQNGSGTSATRVRRFDPNGNLVWLKDERGYLTRHTYDSAAAARTQTIRDVDTSQVGDAPAGWTTPAGGGLHLITDYQHDARGRLIQELGPWHTVDLNGVATPVRTARWTVYHDAAHEIWTAAGYATGTAPDYTFTLVNPVSITRSDHNGNVLEQIQAVRASTSDKLQPTDDFPQSSYVRWTTYQYTDCCLLGSTRVYHTIPASGEGQAGAHYDQTDFGYDSIKRRNRTVSPGGTITFQVFDVRRHVVATYVGTDDSGATETDPTGGGADPNNNMVLVTSYQYDHGQPGGDGNLTEQTQHIDATETRVTAFVYDWRNRRTATDGEIDFYEQLAYDNLNRVVRTERYDTTPEGNLIARGDTLYDDRGRVYRNVRYAVDPATGAVGHALVYNTWYDAAGNVIKSQPSRSKLFTKTMYDGLGRQTIQYSGYDLDETTYAQAGTVADDTILEQTETHYDAVGNVIQTTNRQRHHNAPASQTGALGDASTDPKARVTYTAHWHDALGREIATANYGTNGGTALVRPDTIPQRSDTVLVTTTGYNAAGEAFQTITPAGREDRQFFDAAGRTVKTIQNYVDGIVDIDHPDEDVTVETTYGPDGQVLTLRAKNPATGDQLTRYVYGTTLADSGIASSQLKRAEIYPDSDDTTDPLGDGADAVYDRIEFKYNRQGEVTEIKDQNETIHALDYDNLGRRIHDRITTLGSGVDGAVRRISTTYEIRGMVEAITGWDDATGGNGNVVNELAFEYNDLGMTVREYQEHAGAKDGSTLYVQYEYDTIASGGVFTHGPRPTSVRYPNGRRIHLDYGPTDGIADALGRLAAIRDDDAGSPGDTLAEYAYLGLAWIVVEDYVKPEVRLDYDSSTPGEYAGFDRFGRVIDHRWYAYGASADLDRYTYTYDRAGNRTAKTNQLNHDFDEVYEYDAIDRLISSARANDFAQSWTLDGLGNFAEFDDGGQRQTRTANAANEITGITGGWITPTYDAAGNMISGPKPGDETTPVHYVYDAWNRLVIVQADDSGDPGDMLAEYQYDGTNRRIQKNVTEAGGGPSEAHYFYNGSWQLLEERFVDGQGATVASNRYVWSPRYIDALIVRFHDGNGDGDYLDAGDNVRYYTSDANFNVTAAIDAGTGDVVERYVYTAYGTATVYSATWTNPTAPAADGPLYCGYFFDAEIALYQVRNRYYDSGLSSFISRDPIGYLANDSNLYRYGANRPTSMVDLLGHQGWECLPGATYCPPEYFPPNVPLPPPPPPAAAPPLLPAWLGFLWDFLTGGGDDVRCYCNGEVPLEEMKRSPGAEKLRRAFYRNCCRDTWNVSYGTGEAFVDTIVGGTFFLDTGDQVGGFGGASATVNPDGTVTFTIPNTAGTHSFFYHICPDRPLGSTGPGRTIQQTFQWTEKIDPQRCILTPRSRIDSIEWGRPGAR